MALRQNEGRAVIAVHDPFDRQLIEQLQMLTQGEMELVVSARGDIQRIITEVYGFRSSINAAEQIHGQGLDIGNLEQLTQLTNVENLGGDRPADRQRGGVLISLRLRPAGERHSHRA